jgi:hypothetical protein
MQIARKSTSASTRAAARHSESEAPNMKCREREVEAEVPCASHKVLWLRLPKGGSLGNGTVAFNYRAYYYDRDWIVPVPIPPRFFGVPMMKNRTVVVASLLAFALAVAPVTSAFAGGRHNGGYHGGGPIWGFANAVVATAVAVITAPIAILAAVAQAPLYYAPGPAYAGASPAYATPPAGPGYYGRPAAPTYYGAPQAAPYYARATAPADYSPPAVTYYTPPPDYAPRVAATSYAPPLAARYYAPPQAYYAPPPDYRPRSSYYAPPPDANYYPR